MEAVTNKWSTPAQITWADIIEKFNEESYNYPQHVFSNYNDPFSSWVLTTAALPPTLKAAFDEVKKTDDITVLHVYASLTAQSSTFGRHKDTMDVLLVQAIGETGYRFDDGRTINLKPNDGLIIKKGVHHEPIISEPRVTLSFSWE
jgi:ribosomal protein L16 Arg81 hydroxylase